VFPPAGTVQAIPKQMVVNVGGAPALTIADVAGAPIVGCPNLPTPGTPTFVPCLTVAAPAVMARRR